MLVVVGGRCCILLLYQRTTRLLRRRGQVRATDPPTFRFSGRTYPRWRKSCERCPLSAVAGGRRWLLLLLSPLLSAADPVPHLRGLPGAVTAPCPAQTPPIQTNI